MNITKDYHINVFYSDKDKCYVADIPDLKFCSAFGDRPEEAVHEVMNAKKSWLQAAKKAKKAVPKPQYRPALYQRIP
jgi:predicted RNase H-like HicB family nuclease